MDWRHRRRHLRLLARGRRRRRLRRVLGRQAVCLRGWLRQGWRVMHPLWTGATGSAIGSSPAVADGVVYVGSYDGKRMRSRSAAPAAAGPARHSGPAPPAATSTPRPRSRTVWSTWVRRWQAVCLRGRLRQRRRDLQPALDGGHRRRHRLLAHGRRRRGLRRLLRRQAVCVLGRMRHRRRVLHATLDGDHRQLHRLLARGRGRRRLRRLR